MVIYRDRHGAFRHFRKFKIIFGKTVPNEAVSIIDISRTYLNRVSRSLEILISSKACLPTWTISGRNSILSVIKYSHTIFAVIIVAGQRIKHVALCIAVEPMPTVLSYLSVS
jgi:hypothetical protein